MQHFRKIWDTEKNEFLKSTKGLDRMTAYALFCEKWPEADVTQTAFFNQRSRMKAAGKATYLGSRKARPLYSERLKKGYIQIKIAQPNKWVTKSKWVYMESHPWEDFTEKSNYIFLDGDNRNFSPDNIERVPIKLMGIFCGLGGTVKGLPECTRLNITRARLKKAQLDALEKHGQIIHAGGSRIDKKIYNERARANYKRKREAMKK